MQLSDYKVISLVRRVPKWEPRLQVINIPALNEQVEKETEEAQEEIKIFSDGSCIEGRVSAAVVLFRGGVEKRSVRLR